MRNFSYNKKLNNVLNYIYGELQELGKEEVKRYMQEFKSLPDYNIAQYGNVTIYYADLRKLYKEYVSLQKVSDAKLWEIYKRQVGYVAREMMKEA